MSVYHVSTSRVPRQCAWKTIYHVAEQVKNGYVYDFRNKYVELILQSPVVWIFCNDPPDYSKLSTDRWKVWHLSASRELVEGAAAPVTITPLSPPPLGSIAEAASPSVLILPKKR
jgi:hypothetical protein